MTKEATPIGMHGFVNALEWFSGSSRQELWDIIAFCRRGAFAVW